jgi:hypothetical protein
MLEEADEEVEKLEKWEKIKKRIAIAVTAILLLSYLIYTFPRDIRTILGISEDIRSISITTIAENPGVEGGRVDETENKISTSDSKAISEIMDIFDDYRFRLKLSHNTGGYYTPVTDMDIFIMGSGTSWRDIHLVSDGSIFICRKGHNDNYYIGFFDNRQAVDLYNKLNEYASRHKNQ